jgi:UDP-N-acetylmuramoyl-L-alanyl-D-glutamate--2,6-diaminopimelate ligase
LAQCLQSLSISCGLIGTLGNGFFGALTDVGLTTPDAITLQKICKRLQDEGAKALAMEVSSHSIAQERIQSIHFEMGIFTNLTQDHLDYHGTMSTYADVKHQFLAQAETQQVIVNADDAYGALWLTDLAKQKPLYAYSTHPPAKTLSKLPFSYAESWQETEQGLQARVVTPWGKGECHLPLCGEFNLSNALAALTALCIYGISFEAALKTLSQLRAVPGRMQRIHQPHAPLVIVDYAHKPDALEKILITLRAFTKGKLYCVFGCGGNRDKSKRPIMAQIAERLADRIIVTNDNPRHENPQTIANEICNGFLFPERVTVELDRAKAIEKSIQWAAIEDCILIAGKGAERYQQMGNEKQPFDDVEKAHFYLSMRSKNKC